MKYCKHLFVLLFAFLTGCASLGDQGAFTETDYIMPDMTKHTFVERTKMNLVVPSTHMIYKYQESCVEHFDARFPRDKRISNISTQCKMVQYDKPALLAQDGIANDVIVEMIRAGSLIGSTVYAADKALDAAQAIGQGLSQSGNTTEVNNNTKVDGVSNSYSNSKSDAIALSKSKSKSKAKQYQVQRQYSAIRYVKRPPNHGGEHMNMEREPR